MTLVTYVFFILHLIHMMTNINMLLNLNFFNFHTEKYRA